MFLEHLVEGISSNFEQSVKHKPIILAVGTRYGSSDC